MKYLNKYNTESAYFSPFQKSFEICRSHVLNSAYLLNSECVTTSHILQLLCTCWLSMFFFFNFQYVTFDFLPTFRRNSWYWALREFLSAFVSFFVCWGGMFRILQFGLFSVFIVDECVLFMCMFVIIIIPLLVNLVFFFIK